MLLLGFVGGTGYANHASKEEQIRIAENVLSSQGAGAWPVCGQYLTAAESEPEPEPLPELAPLPDTLPAAPDGSRAVFEQVERAAGDLAAQYGWDVPVVLLNGRQHSFHRVDRDRLSKALDALGA